MRAALAVAGMLFCGCRAADPACRAGAAALESADESWAPGSQTLAVSAPAGARLWVDGGGTEGWVELDSSGAVDVELAPDRTHTALLEQCGTVTETWTLQTEAEPSTTDTPSLAGSAWAADLLSPDLRFLEPPSPLPVASIKDLTGEASAFLLGVDAAGQLHFGFAEVTAGTAWQHSCVSLAELPSVVEGDQLSAGPVTVVLTELPDRRYDIEDLQLTARVVADAERGPVLQDVHLSMALDLRTLPGGNGTATCSLLAAVGSSCVPCADQTDDTTGAEPACWPLDLLWSELAPVPGLLVDPTLPPESQC